MAPRRRSVAALTAFAAAATAVVVAPSTAAAATTLPNVQVRSVTAPLTNLISHTGVTTSASCPTGTMVGGGGYLRNASNPMTLPTNGLVLGGTSPSTGASPVDQPYANGATNPSSWLNYANFTGQSEAGNQSTGFALCATGGPTHTTVVTNSTVGSNAAQQSAPPNLTIATCPVGTTLIGGGAVTNTPDQIQDGSTTGNNGNLKPLGNYPSDAAGVLAANGSTNPTSWSAFGSAGVATATDKVTAFALCTTDAIGGVMVSRVDVSGPNAQPGTTITPGTAVCPVGTQMLGGGYRTDETVNGVSGLQPQQGYHMRGSYPSTTSGIPPVDVPDGTTNPTAWSALLQAGGQGIPNGYSMQLHTFALCAQPTTVPDPTQTATQLNVTPASPAPFGSNETLTATVSPAAAGTVQFTDGTTPIGNPVTVAGSTASLSTTLPQGAHDLRASFTPTDPGAFTGSTSDPVAYTVNAPAATTTQLDVTPASPAPSGTQETLTATVSPSAAGSVQFADGGTPLGNPVPVNGGTASTTATLATGDHSLTATFTSSDPAYTGSASDPVAYTVNAPAPTATTTQLDVTPASPAPSGTQETLTATVSPTAAGSVQFLDGGAPVGNPVPTAGGVASTDTTLASGTHSLTAAFTPDDPAAFAGSTSDPVSYTVNQPPVQTTTQLDITPDSPAPAGTQETITVTVSPAAAGTVQFTDGGQQFGGPVPVNGGTATVTTTLVPGRHDVSAVFVPADPGAFTGSFSNTVPYLVNQPIATTTQLGVTPASPAPSGTEETLTANVSPAVAGTVQFSDGSTALGNPVPVNGGTASTTTTLASGSHSLTAVFTPDDPVAYTGSTSNTVSYTVNQPPVPTTVRLGVSPASPAPSGTQETLTATVTPAAAGTVQFQDGSAPLGSPVTASGGIASGTVTLAPGRHRLFAVFTPADPDAFGGSISDPVGYTVNAPITTTTQLDVTPASPAPSGTQETLSATVSPAVAGTVQFSDGNTALGGPVAVNGGNASTTVTLASGAHSLSAVFTPTDAGGYTGSISNTVAYTVNAPITTTTQLDVTPASPAPSGTQETLSATVSPAVAGTVQFSDGNTALGGPVAVNGGTASTTVTLAPGAHSLSAVFTPTDAGAYTGSISNTVAYTVNAPAVATATQLDVSPASPAPSGTQETLTATVSPAAAGTVQFSDGSTALGNPVAVSGGNASTTTTLSPGAHSLSAVFTPNDPGAYTGSTSNTVAYTVNAPPVATATQLDVSPASPAPSGTQETLTATISPAAAGTVQFSDGNTPLGNPVAVSGGNASTTTTLSSGAHQLSAVFTPADPGAFTGSTSNTVAYTVKAPATTTSTQLGVSPNSPAPSGTQETLSATVTPAAAGTVQFRDGNTALGNPVATSGGIASTSVTLAPGSHSLSAVFTPTDPGAFTGSTSNTVAYTVNAPITTTTQLGVTPASPAPSGTRETLTATVNPAAAGTVQFRDGNTAIGGPVTVNGSTASTSVTLASGTHSLSATFTPANPGAYTGSISNTVAYTVNPPPVATTTGLTVSPTSPAPSGTRETLTAKVSPTAAAGTVQFRDGTTPIGGPVTVNGGTASTATTLGQGNHSLTATFTPANPAAYTGSTSNTVSYTVNPPAKADIAVSVRATPSSGRAFTVTVITSNSGPNTAQEVLTTVTLPKGLRATSAPGGSISSDGRTVVYRTATLAASRSVTATIKVTAGPPASGNQTIGAGAASFYTPDPATRNNTASTTVRVT